MKRSTILFIVLCTSVLTATSLHALINPTFHLKNKSSHPLQIDVIQGLSSVTGLKRIAKNSEFTCGVDITQPTRLILYYCPRADFCKNSLPDKYTVDFKAGKTIYVKFDGVKLTPQKGNVFTRTTTSGHSLNNNVTLQDMWISLGVREPLKTGTKESVTQELKKGRPQSAASNSDQSTTTNKEKLILLLSNPPQFLDNFSFELRSMLNERYDTKTLMAIKTRLNQAHLTQVGPTQKEWKKKMIVIIDDEIKNMP